MTRSTPSRQFILKAASLPADGTTHLVDKVPMRHDPQTTMKVEQVFVQHGQSLFRSRMVKGKWQATELVAGSI